MDHDDLRDLMVMTSQLERMLADVEVAFRTRSLDKAVNVLRADTEIDRLRNVDHLPASGTGRGSAQAR